MALFEPGAPAAPDPAGWNVSSAARALGMERTSLL
jgi:transcriptional regulator of acetoin/glycerol metabolism